MVKEGRQDGRVIDNSALVILHHRSAPGENSLKDVLFRIATARVADPKPLEVLLRVSTSGW